MASLPFGQHAGQLIANPLAGDNLDFVCQIPDGGKRGRLNGVAESRSETDRAQHTQLVFGKALSGITDGADDFGFQILPSADEVEDLVADRIKQHAVDGEIAAGYVFSRILTETHFVRMAAIGVANVTAKGCGFYVSLWGGNEHDAKLRSDRVGLGGD